MDTGYLIMFLGISMLSSLTAKNSAIGMIKRIGINSHYYPKKYVFPSKRFKKLFSITAASIPRYLYNELLISILFAALGPINLIIIAVIYYGNTPGFLLLFHVCLIVLDMMYFSIMSAIFMKRQR